MAILLIIQSFMSAMSKQFVAWSRSNSVLTIIDDANKYSFCLILSMFD